MDFQLIKRDLLKGTFSRRVKSILVHIFDDYPISENSPSYELFPPLNSFRGINSIYEINKKLFYIAKKTIVVAKIYLVKNKLVTYNPFFQIQLLC